MRRRPGTFFPLCVLASSLLACAGPRPGAVADADPGALLGAGSESGPVYVPELAQLGLGDPRAPALLAELCARAPHRLAGSSGAERAVEWAEESMRALGLENVRLEPCLVPRWERGTLEELVVVEPAAHAGERVPILALGGSVATPAGGLTAEVIAVTSYDELHERAAEARGKLVLFRRPMERARLEPFEAYGGAVGQRSTGAIEAAGVGALGALVRSMTMLQDDEPHTGAMRYAEGVERVPAVAVSTNGADRIGAWLDEGKQVVLRLALDCRTLPDVLSANVVGEVVGRELPDEVVLIGGHLDAWDVGEGAHDDGAGCVHALEAARLILRSALGRPRRTVRCVLFMNEENGLRGAQAYRDAHADSLGRHVLAIESDRGGGVPIGYVTDAVGPALDTLVALYGGAPAGRGGGADISPMAEFGVPLAGLLPSPQRYFDFHHSRHDVLGAVHPRELELGAVSLASLAFLAADLAGEWPRNAPAER
jgi:carboxypeptidase Q